MKKVLYPRGQAFGIFTSLVIMAKTWSGPIRPKCIAEKSNMENDFSDLCFASLDA